MIERQTTLTGAVIALNATASIATDHLEQSSAHLETTRTTVSRKIKKVSMPIIITDVCNLCRKVWGIDAISPTMIYSNLEMCADCMIVTKYGQ